MKTLLAIFGAAHLLAIGLSMVTSLNYTQIISAEKYTCTKGIAK